MDVFIIVALFLGGYVIGFGGTALLLTLLDRWRK